MSAVQDSGMRFFVRLLSSEHHKFQSIFKTILAIISSPRSGENDFIIIRVMKNDENKTNDNAPHDACWLDQQRTAAHD